MEFSKNISSISLQYLYLGRIFGGHGVDFGDRGRVGFWKSESSFSRVSMSVIIFEMVGSIFLFLFWKIADEQNIFRLWSEILGQKN